jgi:hypothetical protein
LIRLGVTLIGVALASCESAAVEAASSDEGCDINYAAMKATEMTEIELGLSIYKRFVMEELTEDDLNVEEIESLDRMQMILDSRERPVDHQDLTILESADMRLTGPPEWDHADDRKCEPEGETFSLYCSLYFGSIDTIGDYQHRRTALQEVRFAIDDATGGHEFDHRLMDYNNLLETSFGDIKDIIKTARQRVQDRLKLQMECAL